MVQKWSDYFVDYMKNGERFTFQSNLPFYYESEMTVFREKREKEIDDFLKPLKMKEK